MYIDNRHIFLYRPSLNDSNSMSDVMRAIFKGDRIRGCISITDIFVCIDPL